MTKRDGRQKAYRQIHGGTGTPEYASWSCMIKRCNNALDIEYKNYGGRGITVCTRWYLFKNFLSDMGIRPKGHQLDRINPNGNYSKKNCRWATPKQQSRNTRSNVFVIIKGQKKCIAEWAEITGLNAGTILRRYHKGDKGMELLRKPRWNTRPKNV